MNGSILRENEAKRLDLPTPVLICAALFPIWQMGIGYFSTQTLSLDGRTPLPVEVGDISVLIAVAYIISALFCYFLGRFCVMTYRITLCVSLAASLMIFLPLPAMITAIPLLVQFFCCVFLIGIAINVWVTLFTLKTALKCILFEAISSGVMIAVLQNDIIKIPFPVFQGLTVIIILALLYYLSKMPARVYPATVTKEDKIVCPKNLFTGLCFLIVLSNFLTLFGSAIAESITHGVSFLYLSFAVSGIVIFILWKKLDISPIRSASVAVGISALGFLMATASLYLPVLAIPACLLLGSGLLVCYMGNFYALVMFLRYPARWIVSVILVISMIELLIHSSLLDALRYNLILLYVVYLVIAVTMVITYIIIEPYLLYAFRGKSLISDERAAELIAEGKASAKTASIVVEENECHPDDELTDREKQIAQELMSGLNYNEIANKLFISYHTVNAHVRAIYRKKDVHNVAELIRKIGRLG